MIMELTHSITLNFNLKPSQLAITQRYSVMMLFLCHMTCLSGSYSQMGLLF